MEGCESSPFIFFSVTGPGNKGKLPSVVEHIIDLDVLRAELFDEADIAVLAAPIDLDRNMGFTMILEMKIIKNQLTV